MSNGADPINRLPTAQLPSQPTNFQGGLPQLVQQLLDAGYSWPEISNVLQLRMQMGESGLDPADRSALTAFLQDIHGSDRHTLRDQIASLPDGEFRDIAQDAVGRHDAHSGERGNPVADRPQSQASSEINQAVHREHSLAAATDAGKDRNPTGMETRLTGVADANALREGFVQKSAIAGLAERPGTQTAAAGERAPLQMSPAVTSPAFSTTVVVPDAAVRDIGKPGLHAVATNSASGGEESLAALQALARAPTNAVPPALAAGGLAQGAVAAQGAPQMPAYAVPSQVPQTQIPAPAGHTANGMVGRLFERGATPPVGTRQGFALPWGNAYPQARKRRQTPRSLGQHPVSDRLQWVFWGITLLAYAALAIALLAMVGNGGSGLWQQDGRIDTGGWALVAAIVMGVASLVCGRRLMTASRRRAQADTLESSTPSEGSIP